MVPTRLQQQILTRLNSPVQLDSPYTWKCLCPFHEDDKASFIVQFHFESVFCLTCHYGAPVESFLHHFDSLPQPPVMLPHMVNPGLFPNDSYAHWLNEETCGEIYKHIFLGKVKELARAVEQLNRLIGKMKFNL